MMFLYYFSKPRQGISGNIVNYDMVNNVILCIESPDAFKLYMVITYVSICYFSGMGDGGLNGQPHFLQLEVQQS